jgi:hypothetical protein
MTNINQLSQVTSLSDGDLLIIWNTGNGDSRKVSVSTLVQFIQGQITADDDQETQYFAPNATGFSVTIAPTVGGNDVWLNMTPAAGYAAGTVTLPPVAECIDQQEVLVTSTQAVTTLTTGGNGSTVNGAPAGLTANGFFRLKFNAINTSWYRIG